MCWNPSEHKYWGYILQIPSSSSSSLRSIGMNLKTSKKMRGLMCHSPAATAVCIPGDPRSVIVPRRPDRTLVDHSRLINNAKYSRLVESHRFTPAAKRSVLVPAMKRGHRPSAEPMPFHPPSSTPSLDHVFQVRFMIICKEIFKYFLITKLLNMSFYKIKIISLYMHCQKNIFNVVVMRVSLHCQGCAGKVKKHLSKMEGVTSFSIDLETKRVTVMGHVSPSGVLESISKVKKAELWSC
ncbi:unnamed protein product, partial [Vitis vinifera]